MTPGGKIDDMADHLSIWVACNFSSARRTGVGADVGIGINIQDVKNTVPEPDVKPGIVTATNSSVCEDTGSL